MLILTPENDVLKESYWVNKMLEDGLPLLHIRKPGYSAIEFKRYVKEISKEFYDRLVVHQYHTIAQDVGIKRLHYTETARESALFSCNDSECVYSTSVHSIEVFNGLSDKWKYAFLSPFFSSVSKIGYGGKSKLVLSLEQRENNQVSLVALGGITTDNMRLVKMLAVEDVALLGAIWQNENPYKMYQVCKKVDLMC